MPNTFHTNCRLRKSECSLDRPFHNSLGLRKDMEKMTKAMMSLKDEFCPVVERLISAVNLGFLQEYTKDVMPKKN